MVNWESPEWVTLLARYAKLPCYLYLSSPTGLDSENPTATIVVLHPSDHSGRGNRSVSSRL
jgi:hypothetical protein